MGNKSLKKKPEKSLKLGIIIIMTEFKIFCNNLNVNNSNNSWRQIDSFGMNNNNKEKTNQLQFSG